MIEVGCHMGEVTNRVSCDRGRVSYGRGYE